MFIWSSYWSFGLKYLPHSRKLCLTFHKPGPTLWSALSVTCWWQTFNGTHWVQGDVITAGASRPRRPVHVFYYHPQQAEDTWPSLIVKPKSSPKSKSQIQIPNLSPKSKIQSLEERDWDWGWHYIILQATTTHHPTTNNFSFLEKTIYDLPWPT